MLTIKFDRLQIRPGSRVLDVGAGFGRHAFEVARRGGRVVALDYAADEVTQTRATIGAMVADENIKGFLAFRAEWVHNVLGTAPSMLAALTAVGDSMSPTISPGDTLLIDRNVERITEGAIYVIEVDGALLTKRVQLRRDGTLVLRSDNAHYEPDQMPRAEARLIGRVRWIARLV